ncbi:hypothetical protein GCM10007989_26000 [Devosia pacifica]|uniref:Uncharacterized protein n=1 Tax=Devosia pacifica TaxID=1335967 RepID=A0A918S8S2_9HYPH|nr:hypothetical protein [Devosia pacifica]GHA29227.1 hypothetical protein GCM10007989_26000 [Devosia pacifica]
MSHAAARTVVNPTGGTASGSFDAAENSAPFAGLLESVTIDPVVDFSFDGAIRREDIAAAWTWVCRDLAPEICSGGNVPADTLARATPELLTRWAAAQELADQSEDQARRLRAQLGGEGHLEHLPKVYTALQHVGLLGKGQALGRVINDLGEDEKIITAIRSLPLKSATATALFMTALMGQVANPARLMIAVSKIAGGASELRLRRAGFAPTIEAILVQAQNQLHLINPLGTFADVDLTCRGLERYHRLSRSVAGYIELVQRGEWGRALAELTKAASRRLEPRLHQVCPEIAASFREQSGDASVAFEQRLAAISGTYLLAAVRDCRDSLAVNATFDQAWHQSGQLIDSCLNRGLEQMRAGRKDPAAMLRLDTAAKLSEIRFGPEYAERFRKTMDNARRQG